MQSRWHVSHSVFLGMAAWRACRGLARVREHCPFARLGMLHLYSVAQTTMATPLPFDHHRWRHFCRGHWSGTHRLHPLPRTRPVRVCVCLVLSVSYSPHPSCCTCLNCDYGVDSTCGPPAGRWCQRSSTYCCSKDCPCSHCLLLLLGAPGRLLCCWRLHPSTTHRRVTLPGPSSITPYSYSSS